MTSPIKKAVAGGALAVAAATATYVLVEPEPTQYTVYINGSSNVEHDVKFGEMVDSDVQFGLYCTAAAGELADAKQGDVAITMRSGSALYCAYMNPVLPTIAVVGFDNNSVFVGNDAIPEALVIDVSNYGRVIDYHIDSSSLSAAMPAMANIITTVNSARVAAGLPSYGMDEMRKLLDNSSDVDFMRNGSYAGQLIDVDNAVSLAVGKATIGWLPPVLTLLIL